MAQPSIELNTFDAPLLADDSIDQQRNQLSESGLGEGNVNVDDATTDTTLSSATTRRLYLSHFLSTWNSRLFEFGTVLYLASIFPGTLLPVSVYALARGASAALLAPAVGWYVDAGSRLRVVRLSIVVQRLAVAASCSIFWFLATDWRLDRLLTTILLVCLVVLACVEKLSSIMNLVAVEKDWVVVVAGGDESSLRLLNSQMRRIDLFCKLGGPFVISIIDGFSTEIAILVNLALNIASVGFEYYAIARVWRMVPTLQNAKAPVVAPEAQGNTTQRARSVLNEFISELSWYFRHPAVRASFAGALLYFTVLSFAGQMTTYLLAAGYNSFHIAATRTASVGFEISATWIAPLAMARLGPVRSGIWFINGQLLCLTGAVVLFWTVDSSIGAASGLVAGTILSRIGLWGFDLSTQIIVQEEVEDGHRGSFSSIEASLQNLFELLSYLTTMIFSRPHQFRWPVLMSWIAVYVAALVYASFVRSRRGHLVHFSKCIEPDRRKRGLLHDGYQRLPSVRDT